MRPSVEVFVLSFNDGWLASRAVESVLAQSHGDFRLTILDNGSTDSSRAQLRTYLTDSRVRLVAHERNIRSVMGARYLQRSQADCISILFADDTYEPDRLAVMLDGLGEADAIFSNNNYVNERREPVEPPRHIASVSDVAALTAVEHLRRFYVSGNSLHPCAMLVRTEAYRRFGGFPAYLHRLGDMYFFAKLLGGARVRLIGDRLQNITVWSDLRNESAGNVTNPIPSLMESNHFWDLYAREPLLSQVDEIFGSHLAWPHLESEAERLWFLGTTTVALGDWWKMPHAFRCLYQALELDEATIDRKVLQSSGMTASEYVAHLAARDVPGPPVVRDPPGPVTLRRYLRQFKVLHPPYRLAMRLLASTRGTWKD